MSSYRDTRTEATERQEAATGRELTGRQIDRLGGDVFIEFLQTGRVDELVTVVHRAEHPYDMASSFKLIQWVCRDLETAGPGERHRSSLPPAGAPIPARLLEGVADRHGRRRHGTVRGDGADGRLGQRHAPSSPDRRTGSPGGGDAASACRPAPPRCPPGRAAHDGGSLPAAHRTGAPRARGHGRLHRCAGAMAPGLCTGEAPRTFQGHIRSAVAQLASHDLRARADLARGGCRDDRFDDFRAWIVAQGRAAFGATLELPTGPAARRSMHRARLRRMAVVPSHASVGDWRAWGWGRRAQTGRLATGCDPRPPRRSAPSWFFLLPCHGLVR